MALILTLATIGVAGCVMVKLNEPVHPFESTTEQTQVPAVRPEAEAVASPIGVPVQS
ncbi:hypothetical protein [Flavobacterium sp. 3HN19-14]|uniref:hypothetical protein n=1 Tax=Flavobacterium sp. 3HN19-14 TaxID=3448133 RepID=UPI003EDF3990